jgi:hypothetical protein
VRRARLAPAMISMPGHRGPRRRQRGALPAWLLSGRARAEPLRGDPNAATSAADEIDIAGCAAIAYTSEDPAHPVEHMLDGCDVGRAAP